LSNTVLICLADMLDNPELFEDPVVVVPYLNWERRLTLFAGREKSGKSTLATAAAAAITRGGSFLSQGTELGNVLWVSYEETKEDIGRRFLGFKGDPKRFFLLVHPGELFREVIEACETHDFSLIVWDSLARIADAICKEVPDPNNSQLWTRIIAPILDISHDYASGQLIHHSRKSDGKYRDSTAIGGMPDVIVEMFKKKDNDRLLKKQGRYGMSEDLITLTPDGFKFVATGSLESRIKDFVGKNPTCSWDSLRRGVTGKTGSIKEALDKLLKDGSIVNKGDGKAHAYHLFSFSRPRDL